MTWCHIHYEGFPLNERGSPGKVFKGPVSRSDFHFQRIPVAVVLNKRKGLHGWKGEAVITWRAR